MVSGLASKRMICAEVVWPGPIVTVVLAVTLPEGPTAVKVYVVVAVGFTVVEPVAATLPITLLMETLVAPWTIQVSVEGWPAAMLFGVASKRTIVAPFGVVEVTRVVAEEESPPASVTVRRKTYVWPATAVNVVRTPVGAERVT